MVLISKIDKTKLIRVLAIGSLVLSLLIAGFFAVLNRYWSDGDETHYLIMTASAIYDRDFDLKNNYLGTEYYSHRGKKVNLHGIIADSGAWISHHDILLPLFVSPGYYARGIIGARLVQFLFFVIGILGMYLYLKILKFKTNLSLVTLAMFVLIMPILAYSHYVYTDLLSGFLIVFAIIPLLLFEKKEEAYLLLLSSFIFGLSMFLHIKLILFGPLFLFAYYLYQSTNKFASWKLKEIFWPKRKNFLIGLSLIVPWIFFLILYCLKNWLWVGSYMPDAIHNLVLERLAEEGQGDVQFFDYNPINMILKLLATLFDGEVGLFSNGPFFLLMIPGLYLWYKKSRNSFFLIAIPLAILLIRQSGFIVWRTWGPPARYMMVFLPILIPALAWSIEYFWKKRVLQVVVVTLFIFSLLITSTLFFARDATKSGYPTYSQKNIYTRSAFNYISKPEAADFFYLEVLKTDNLSKKETNLLFRADLLGVSVSVLVVVIFCVLGVYSYRSTNSTKPELTTNSP